MIVDVTQRWRARSNRWRSVAEVVDVRAFEVGEILDDGTARSFVCTHHYSGSYPAALRRFGLYRKGGGLAGVAVFSVPAQPKSLAVLPGGPDLPRGELGRFVLLDDVAQNGETWFLARCFDVLRRDGWSGVVSFSDPERRTTSDGRTIFGGHIGTIYQASNACYLGRSAKRRAQLLPDGTMLHPRALAKIRKRDRGWRYASDMLARHGAEPLEESDDACAWLRRWLPRITRPLVHGGNHKYAWALQSRDRKRLPASLPYPKILPAVQLPIVG